MLDAMMVGQRAKLAERRQRVGAAHRARILASGTPIPRRWDHASLGQQSDRPLGSEVEHDGTFFVPEDVAHDTVAACRGAPHHTVRT